MIVPIAPSILKANPQFASLHKHLTTVLLNPDGSTRAKTEAHAPVREALRLHHINAAKVAILKSSLRNVAARSDEDGSRAKSSTLPPEMVELVGTISMILDEEAHLDLSEHDVELLQPEIDAFTQNVKMIGCAITSDLAHQNDILCRMATTAATASQSLSFTKSTSTSTSTTNKPSSYPSSSSFKPGQSLPALLTALLPSVIPPPSSRLFSTLTTTLSILSTLHLTLLTHAITHLERTTHGLHARHTKARAAHLAAVAVGLVGRIRVQTLQCRHRLYTPQVQLALENYTSHLERLEEELGENLREYREVLEAYDDVDACEYGEGERGTNGEEKGQEERRKEGKHHGGIMREVGKRYGDVLREIEGVKGEIRRLKGVKKEG